MSALTANFRPQTVCCAIFTALLLSGCSQPSPRQDLFDTSEREDADGRGYKVVGSKRYLSGPYGDADKISAIAAAIKQHSQPNAWSARALEFPNNAAYNTITVFDYRFPDNCGSGHFQLFEGEGLQVLEYEYRENNGKAIRIRDYITGPSPFVEAGLWGPYDHTAETARDMCLLPGVSDEDGLGLLQGSYEIGWVTTLAKWKQAELGQAYQRAVDATVPCLTSALGPQSP